MSSFKMKKIPSNIKVKGRFCKKNNSDNLK